jgi:hypothetical protein
MPLLIEEEDDEGALIRWIRFADRLRLEDGTLSEVVDETGEGRGEVVVGESYSPERR